MNDATETIHMCHLDAGAAYDLLTATIAPRPVAMVTTQSADGEPNLAPFSFLVLGGANPPSLVFSAIVGPDGVEKETLRNIQETGEFVVNTVHREMMDAVALAATKSGSSDSKWERAGLTSVASVTVAPPRIAESHVQLECRVFQIVEHGSGPGAGRYVIAEVVVAHVWNELLDDGKVVGDRVRPITRLGGKSYLDTQRLELFT